jgi:hypothetical protein
MLQAFIVKYSLYDCSQVAAQGTPPGCWYRAALQHMQVNAAGRPNKRMLCNVWPAILPPQRLRTCRGTPYRLPRTVELDEQPARTVVQARGSTTA